MAGVPALPSGYVMDGPPRRDPNLLGPLLDAGAVPTNGYRTPGDIERLKREG